MPDSKKPRYSRFDRLIAAVAGTLTLALLATAIWPLSGPEAPETVKFIGRFHPILVHLPIGFLFALLLLELFDLFIRSAILHHSTYIMAWLATGAALLAVAAGVLLAYSGHYSDELLFWHRWLGVLTAVFAVWILAWKVSRSPRERHGWSFAYHPLLVVTALLLAGAGHYGGSLTHGSDYLTAYMPNAFRPYLNIPERQPPRPVEPLEEPLDAIVFESMIQPILKTSCVSCHGPEKQRNGLRLDSYAALIEGGESGPDVHLIPESLRLPLEDDRHMPPRNRPQLSADEIALIEWWVESGASPDAKVRDLPATRRIGRILADRFGLEDAEETVAMREWEEIEATVNELNTNLGINMQRVARGMPAVELPFLASAAGFGDEELARLEPVARNLVELNLSRSQVTDDGLAVVGKMKNLRRLNLSNTSIGDAGLTHLAGLSRLEYLNAYGTPITDEGLLHLDNLSSLRKIYLWQSGVTAEGVERLFRGLFDEARVAEWQAEIQEIEARIAASNVEIELGNILEVGPGNSDGSGYSDDPDEADDPVASDVPKPENEECPISGRAVDPEFVAVHEGTAIGFCCGDCLAKFEEDPESVLASDNPEPENEECPISGRAVNPEHVAVHEGTAIGFCCGDCLARFKEDPEPVLAKLNQ